MQSEEIRKRFLAFFEKRGHKILPSASLVPENDPSALFTTAGMQPLAPYLLGQEHPAGRRLTDIQKCVRTGDIDEVGDNTHLTFFEMLGNWSLGNSSVSDEAGRTGYFKEEAIRWSYELLTNKEEGFGLDPHRLYVTCFAGDENAPRDEESARIWQEVGVPESRIYFLPADKNWWSPGDNGPCGPDTEMYYDVTEHGLGDLTLEEFQRADDEQRVVEIWNDVFMEYEKKAGKVVGKLAQKNVDTGAGLERVTAVLQNKDNVFATDLFQPIMAKIDTYIRAKDDKAQRIVADHLRASIFMINDGVEPSNTDRGYVLRRLLRRAIRYADSLKMLVGLSEIGIAVIGKYKEVYPELEANWPRIREVINKEEIKFRATLERGMKIFEKILREGKNLDGKTAFDLYQTYGFPIELIEEVARERGLQLDLSEFESEKKKHQDLSRLGAGQKFKGGLGGTSDKIVKYHTATHLLLQALTDVLGNTVMQRGSNITDERLRLDFSFDRKLTDEEKEKVEKIINEKIAADLSVQSVILSREEAEKTGARHAFGERYGEEVTVYFIGESLDSAYSKEFCGGPHVDRTGILGHFKITKEEAVAAGIRRIKAILE